MKPLDINLNVQETTVRQRYAEFLQKKHGEKFTVHKSRPDSPLRREVGAIYIMNARGAVVEVFKTLAEFEKALHQKAVLGAAETIKWRYPDEHFTKAARARKNQKVSASA